MTTTLSRPQVDVEASNEPATVSVVRRWHQLRRVGGLTAAVLGVIGGVLLSWPAMAVIAALGAVAVIDSTLALRSDRRSVGPTLIADITLTGVGLVVASVPAAATGLVVAYYVLLIAVLSESVRSWPIGLYAVLMGIGASVIPSAIGYEVSTERSLIAGVLVVAVFGVSLVVIAGQFVRAKSVDSREAGRRIEVADAVAKASSALVSEADASALATSLEAVRSAMGVAVVFVERNVHDPEYGMTAVVVERAADPAHTHPSLDRAAKVPWSSMPGARAHLEGGAPFFYRVEESRGTVGDRSGEGALKVEVNVPIVVHGDWVGVIGAADTDGERTWRTDDLLLLRTMADLTAAFWQRARNEKVRDTLIGTLDGRLRYEEAIARASRALLGERVGGVEPALRAVGEAIGAERVIVSAHADGYPAETLAVWMATGLAPVDAASRADGEATRALHADIEVEGVVLAELSVVDADTGRPWVERDKVFIGTIAEMLGAFYGRAQDRARLQASLTSKDQLIASVSHELRTPLTAVGGLADELRDAGDGLGQDERSELLRLIADETKDMADLVEDLLVAARSHDGAMSVFPESTDLGELARSTLAALHIPDGVAVSVEAEHAPAYADPTRVRQIVRNLVTNAFRYGGNRVSISFDRDDAVAYLTVHDDGTGIAAQDREQIFEPYGRGHSGVATKASIGLGLTVSRRLAELMGGSLEYLDAPGATFRLTVPRWPADEQRPV